MKSEKTLSLRLPSHLYNSFKSYCESDNETISNKIKSLMFEYTNAKTNQKVAESFAEEARKKDAPLSVGKDAWLVVTGRRFLNSEYVSWGNIPGPLDAKINLARRMKRVVLVSQGDKVCIVANHTAEKLPVLTNFIQVPRMLVFGKEFKAEAFGDFLIKHSLEISEESLYSGLQYMEQFLNEHMKIIAKFFDNEHF